MRFRCKSMALRRLAVAFFVLLLSTSLQAQDLTSFEENRDRAQLTNGMKFIIVERHEVPVVSFHTYADVGSVDEEAGISGMAHMFEHMAFKGTSDIGTKDIEAEKKALAKVDEAYAALQEERRRRLRGLMQPASKSFKQAFEQAKEEAARYAESDEFTRIIEENGGVGLNAGTGFDSTAYYISFPSNKLELWFSLESARFLDPVLREFYKERDVVIEERRLRVDSQPVGKLIEEFLSVAYKAHPYGRNAIGWQSDLENMTREQARRFFEKYYTPPNLTAVIVGDVDPKEAIRLAELYFGRIPQGAPTGNALDRGASTGRRTASRGLCAVPTRPSSWVTTSRASIIPTTPSSMRSKTSSPEAEHRASIEAWSRTRRSPWPLEDSRDFRATNTLTNFFFTHFPRLGHTNEENEEAMLVEIEPFKDRVGYRRRALARQTPGASRSHRRARLQCRNGVPTSLLRSPDRRLAEPL